MKTKEITNVKLLILRLFRLEFIDESIDFIAFAQWPSNNDQPISDRESFNHSAWLSTWIACADWVRDAHQSKTTENIQSNSVANLLSLSAFNFLFVARNKSENSPLLIDA